MIHIYCEHPAPHPRVQNLNSTRTKCKPMFVNRDDKFNNTTLRKFSFKYDILRKLCFYLRRHYLQYLDICHHFVNYYHNYINLLTDCGKAAQIENFLSLTTLT
jgi:hypothetical protein